MLYNKLLKTLEIAWREELGRIKMEDGLVVLQEPGHTTESARGRACHSGPKTAEAYANAVLLGGIEERQMKRMLDAIAALQFCDPASPYNGCFCWFQEDACVEDTNAAFFIEKPLVLLRVMCPDRILEAHRQKIDSMLLQAIPWFCRECREPELYYPNKTVSDGAMLYAIASVTGRQEAKALAVAHMKRWVAYTRRRGWGWGENTSAVYLSIVLDALCLTAVLSESEEPELHHQIILLMEELYKWVRFHGTCDFVPSIRDYNVEGRTENKNFYLVCAGVSDDTCNADQAVRLILHRQEIERYEENHKKYLSQTSDEYIQHIFDRSCATAWKGVHGRMGTISCFPPMKNCYQCQSWGIGWQSMPASFLIYGEKMGYLRLRTMDHGLTRSHPVQKRLHPNQLNAPLFSEEMLPRIKVTCQQNKNMALAVRRIEGLHNVASLISDEWVVREFCGKAFVIKVDGRPWAVLQFEACTVLIGALMGIRLGAEKRVQGTLSLTEGDGELRICQTLYCGEEKELHAAALESGWAVIFVDGLGEPRTLLASTEIMDIEYSDGEIPRRPDSLIRSISMENTGGRAVLVYDPEED